jgi:hypothetical protein
MEQYRQLSSHCHYGSLLGIFSSSLRKLQPPSPQIFVHSTEAPRRECHQRFPRWQNVFRMRCAVSIGLHLSTRLEYALSFGCDRHAERMVGKPEVIIGRVSRAE